MTAEGKNDFTSIRAKNYSVNVSNFTSTCKVMKENKMAQSFSDRQAKNALNNIPFLRLFVATCNLPFKTDRYF